MDDHAEDAHDPDESGAPAPAPTDEPTTVQDAAAVGDGPVVDGPVMDGPAPAVDATADGEPDASDGNRRTWIVAGAVVAVVLIGALVWLVARNDDSESADGDGPSPTAAMFAPDDSSSTASTETIAPGVAAGKEGGVVLLPGSVPSSSTSTPPDSPGGSVAPSSTAPSGGSGSDGGATLPTVVTGAVTIRSGPDVVYRAPVSSTDCGANSVPWVVRAPDADQVELYWTTGPASGQIPMERSGDEWTATLVGPMSGQATIEVRAIGGATDGGMSASEPRSVDLRDCPG
jgi:hypothetical protein